MLDFVDSRLRQAEEVAAAGADVKQVLAVLRGIDVDNFGMLLDDMPNARWPALSRVLPAAPTPETQRHLTGDSGRSLLQKSVRFTRIAAHHFHAYTGRPLNCMKVLDFGFGYGRLTRMMLRYTDPECIFGCDPAPRSLQWASESRLPGAFRQSDDVLTNLPFGDEMFDLIYAFSVFTHLSHEATRAALTTLSQAVRDNGLLIITIRPADFWRQNAKLTNEERVALTGEQQTSGFAFRGMTPTYGDTTISFEWIRINFPELDILGYDWSFSDPHQICVFIRSNWRSPRAWHPKLLMGLP